MKSIFLTILIFAGVFAAADSGILSVISKDWFHYAAYSVLAVVVICGFLVTLHTGKTSAGKEVEHGEDAASVSRVTAEKERKDDK